MSREYQQIADAIGFIHTHHESQPSLESLADRAGMSPQHFQRVFSRWAGISPKRMIQFLTATNAGQLLRRRMSTLDVSLDVGLSSNSRLHDLFVRIHGMSPDEYRHHATEIEIHWGHFESPFGRCLIGTTDKGVCWLSFCGDDDCAEGRDQMEHEWAGAIFVPDHARAAEVGEQIFADTRQGDALSVFVKGTNFQIRVWEALLRIPSGTTATYGDISRHIGNPRASRAVGSAIGANPVSWLIPCHRVIQSSGMVGGYRWGPNQKRMILLHEMCQADAA